MNFIVKKYYELLLDYQQKKLNKEYKKYGLSDEVLDKQIEINKKRHKYNISDKNERIYENWVQ